MDWLKHNWLLIVLVVLIGLLFWKVTHTSPETIDHTTVQIDSIKKCNDSIQNQIIRKDSVLTITKTIYEKERIHILNNDVDSDMLFFSKYLSTEAE